MIFITVIVYAGCPVFSLFCLCFCFCKISSCFSSFMLFLSTSIFPLFPGLAFFYYCIVHLIIPPPGFFVPWTPTSCLFTYLIRSFKKSIFDIFQSALHFCRNLLAFQIPFVQQYLSTVVLLIQQNHRQVTCVVQCTLHFWALLCPWYFSVVLS